MSDRAQAEAHAAIIKSGFGAMAVDDEASPYRERWAEVLTTTHRVTGLPVYRVRIVDPEHQVLPVYARQFGKELIEAADEADRLNAVVAQFAAEKGQS
jgi:hypothetical protein